ncbi:hypothetical protein QTP88_008884 [Uroleucon formosanum]
MVRHFKCPVNVSPLIRATRWGMLMGGVVYGIFRQNALQNYENTCRERRLQMQMEREEGILKLTKCAVENFSATLNEDQKTTTAPTTQCDLFKTFLNKKCNYINILYSILPPLRCLSL